MSCEACAQNVCESKQLMATASELAVAEPQASRLHEATTKCEAAGFNIYDVRDQRAFPPITYTAGEPEYGVITADPNAGLRLAQSRQLTLEGFNSGCVNPQGCVSNAQDGFACAGPVKEQTPFMRALYNDLNGPVAPGNFEYNPPSYVMGVKLDTVNSVTGWEQGTGGRPRWQAAGNVSPCTQTGAGPSGSQGAGASVGARK